MTEVKNQIKRKKYSINTDEQTKQKITEEANKLNITSNKLIAKLWTAYERDIFLSEEQEQEVEQAAAIYKESVIDFKRRAIIKAAKRTRNSKDKIEAGFQINPNSKTSSRAADIRVNNIVQEMIENNKQANDKSERRFISQKAIDNYAKDKRRKNPEQLSLGIAVIRRYLKIHQDKIDAHHKEYELTEKHNLIYGRKLSNNKKIEDIKNDRIFN